MRKRYGAEFVGTFAIVFAPVALSATANSAGGDSGHLAAALVSGLAVLAMIVALGPVSAAHFNPAVTLGFACAGRFPWRFVVPYWLSQLSGAILAGAVVALLFGPGHGAHVPAQPDLVARNVGTEFVLTFLLVFVIIAVATDRRASDTAPAMAIGLTVVFAVLIGAPVTGGSMNPARSLGPAVFAGLPALRNYWIYVLGPLGGAVAGALAFEALRLDAMHAKGAPHELMDAQKQPEAIP